MILYLFKFYFMFIILFFKDFITFILIKKIYPPFILVFLLLFRFFSFFHSFRSITMPSRKNLDPNMRKRFAFWCFQAENKRLNSAKNQRSSKITTDLLKMIKHRWRFIFNNKEAWLKKRKQDKIFDVTMGRYDGSKRDPLKYII